MRHTQSVLYADIRAYAQSVFNHTGTAPSTSAVAREFSIDRHTARKHMDSLKASGQWPGTPATVTPLSGSYDERMLQAQQMAHAAKARRP